jgi:hypothetical protein
MIEEVVKNSPAMRAGLQACDLIIKVNDEAIKSPEHLAHLVDDAKVGDRFVLACVRNGAKEDVTVELKSTPGNSEIARTRMPWFDSWGTFGLRPSWFDPSWSAHAGSPLTAIPNVNTGSDPTKSKSWSESQSMKMSRDTDGNYDVHISSSQNGDSVERKFKGSHDEVITAIDEDKALPDSIKTRLKKSLAQEPMQPGKLTNDLVNKMKQGLDKPLFGDGFFDPGPFSDTWFDDNWINRVWSVRPVETGKSIFDDDSGVSTDSFNEKQDEPDSDVRQK